MCTDIAIIEWGAILGSSVPQDRIEVKIIYDEEGPAERRRVQLMAFGDESKKHLQKWEGADDEDFQGLLS